MLLPNNYSKLTARNLADKEFCFQSIQVINLCEFAECCFQAGRCTGTSSDYLFICVFKGHVIVDTIQDEYIVNAKHIYLLNAEHLNRMVADEETSGFVIRISELFLSELQMIKEFSILSAPCLSSKKRIPIYVNELFEEDVRNILFKMWDLFSAYTDNSVSLLKSLFKIFLLYISVNDKDDVDDVFITRDSEIASRFCKLVSEAQATRKRIDDYARELHVSCNYLTRIIKRCMGISPINYVHQRYVLSAKKMATETSLSMKEIAYELGFEDTSHFSKFFKLKTGFNFTEYKKSLLLFSNEPLFITQADEREDPYC